MDCSSSARSSAALGGENDGTAADANGARAPSETSAASAEPDGITASDFCRVLAEAGGACGKKKTRVRVARDPNAKYGPQGDLLPGQLLTYTITYENEGAGDAYGVYVVDPLSEVFDDGSLAVLGGGRFITATRTIVWKVGDLKPKGQVGSTGAVTFTVKLKPGLPSGTVVVNQATVYFPSVPEETPTNPVVNVVQPLAARPQDVQTAAGQAVAITLQGVEASGLPLTFTVQASPLNGRLSGTAPSLTYTPAANFSGQDRFSFIVSNGITESRAAEISIVVVPSPTDSTAPEVLWTSPAANASLPEVQSTPVLTDSAGAGYAPSIAVQFSEALSTTTVTTATIRLADAGGRAVTITVGYDAFAKQVTITPRRALGGGRYTVALTRNVQDVAGNGLAADYSFSFDVAGPVAAQQYRVYLPATFKKLDAGW
ncbi:MAG: Ig-like domain-containing protein [Chloroflexi bacterium]|nr:Ig-like domain-containing protein [Chloroflexota bacterium]